MSKSEFERHLHIIAKLARESSDHHRKQCLAFIFLRVLNTYRNVHVIR